MDLSLTASRTRQWTVLTVVGEVDAYTSDLLRARVDEIITGGSNHLVLDMQQVTFLDSAGLRVLVQTLKRLNAGHGELRLVTDDPGLMKVFEISGLGKSFHTFPRLEDAVAEPAGPARTGPA